MYELHRTFLQQSPASDDQSVGPATRWSRGRSLLAAVIAVALVVSLLPAGIAIGTAQAETGAGTVAAANGTAHSSVDGPVAAGSTDAAPAGSASVSIETPVSPGQSSVDIRYDAGSGEKVLLAATADTQSAYDTTVTGSGTKRVSASAIGGISDGTPIIAAIIDPNQSSPSDTDFVYVGTDDGEIPVELSAEAGSDIVEVTYDLSNLPSDANYGLTVENRRTGERYTESVSGSNTATTDASTLGGIEAGDTLSAAITIEGSGPSLTLGSASLTVEENVTEGPDFVFTPSTIAFNATTPGASTTATLRIEHNDVDPVTFERVSIEGPGADAFSVEREQLSLDAVDETTLTVTFAPDSAGEYNGTMLFETADFEIQPVTVTGTARDETIQLSTQRLSFGDLVAGESTSQDLVLTTPTDSPIEVSDVRLVSGDTDAFSLGVTNGTVPAEGRLSVPVTFAPDRHGPARATLAVVGPSGDRVGTVRLTGNASTPELAVDRTSIQFPNVAVGEQVSETVTVSNEGNATLTVERAELAETRGVFGLQGGGSFALEPGEQRELTVTFAPEREREPSTSLYVRSNDPTNPTRVVTISSGRVEVVADVDERNRTTQVQATAEQVSPDDPATIEVPDATEDSDFDVDNVSVATTEESSVGVNITTSDRQLDTTPDTDAGFPNATRQLGNISVDATVSNDRIQEVSFTHRVSTERLADLNTTAEDVVLYRYNETLGEWVEQDTRVVAQRNGVALLRTTGDGFSEWTAAAKRPDIRVADAEASVTAATVGEDVVIQVELTNDGGADGVFETRLLLNGEIVDQEDVTVPESSTVPVSFQRSLDEKGDYQVTVNDVPVGTIKVDEETGETNVSQSTGTQTGGDGTETNDSDSEGDDGGFSSLLPLIAAVGILVAAGIGGSLYLRSGDDGDAVDTDATTEETDTTLEVEGFGDDEE